MTYQRRGEVRPLRHLLPATENDSMWTFAGVRGDEILANLY